MSQTSTLKGQCIAEFLGTGLLIFFGVGCVAALKVAGASFGQWEISIIWGLGVAMAIYLTAGVSGAPQGGCKRRFPLGRCQGRGKRS